MNPLSSGSLAATDTTLWPEFIKSIFLLCVVLIVLIGFLLLLKKFLSRQLGGSSHGYIKMLASHYLSQKERIVLMDVLGEKILIGVTTQGINCLAKISADNMPDTGGPELPETGKKNFMKRTPGNDEPIENTRNSYNQ